MEVLASERCDVLVADLTMPGRQPDGLPMLATIHRKYPSVRIVLFTESANPRLLHLALAAGARCIISKNSEMDELPQAIIAAARGKSYIDQSLRVRLDTRSSAKPVRGINQLSRREIEVLRLIAMHRTVSEIALLQCRSVTTVSHQKNSAMRKLGLTTEAELHIFLNKDEFAL